MPTQPSLPPWATDSAEDSVDSFLLEAAAVYDPSIGETGHATLKEGDTLADRFVIERLAGRGGMGTVYRAMDRMSGTRVALKVMARGERGDARFAQEARVLSELTHPAIVRYVAHGATSQGEPFLAMEWLEGEDLAQRLSRAGLSVAESLTVVRRVAEGLAVAHARGLVHRDVKPSNVFLVGGDASRAKLLDFGIVRLQLSAQAPAAMPMTRTGMILGTVGYMSPEQATADKALDARTDVFALGCVLFECLTGQPAFAGAHVVAVLAKVLREEAPRVRQLRPDLSEGLDDLLARMLAKDKMERPPDGAALLRELDALGSISGSVPSAGLRPSPGLSGGEQRLVSVLLAVVRDPEPRVSQIARLHGGEVVRLANGPVLVTMSGRATTSEQVVPSALCALELHHAFPAARIVLCMGRAQTTAVGQLGPVIDQAASLLARSTSSGIPVDAVTAGLLGDRFEVRSDAEGPVLVGRRGSAEPPRTLLGKPTPCVGRDKELGLLHATLRECIEESVSRAVVVTGPPGQGKSRLRHEFVREADARGQVRILTARADPIGAGSSFMLVRQLVRQAIGLREGDPTLEQYARLRGYISNRCKEGDSGRIADFLGELIGVSSTGGSSPELRSARNDAQMMAHWLARSFGEWLAAECATVPLLVVLEDLHWGDLPSVNYLGEGLRTLRDRPLMLLALARSEVHDTFPNLWQEAEAHGVPLGRLAPRAAERLVRATLGETIGADTVACIVERADGNAFYLEELIRQIAEGGGERPPETVLALVQSRLERLPPEARRMVRAASILGEAFWRGGVAATLGGSADSSDLDGWLTALVRQEVISGVGESRFAGEREYIFRHGLLREAGYAMLTESDRASGHRTAGEWLERAGEKDALTIADHFERGGDPIRAIRCLVEATKVALDGGNVDATIVLSDRALACGAKGADRGQLMRMRGMACFSSGDSRAAVAPLREAMTLLPPGGTQWFVAATGAFGAGWMLGDLSLTGPVLQEMASVVVTPEPSAIFGWATWTVCGSLAAMGQVNAARSFLARAEAIGTDRSDPDLGFLALLRLIQSHFRHYFDGELGPSFDLLLEGRRLAERSGFELAQVVALFQEGLRFGTVGDCDRAEMSHRALVTLCEPRRIGFYPDLSALYLASNRLAAGRGHELSSLLSGQTDQQNPVFTSFARGLRANALLQVGKLSAAKAEATATLEEGLVFVDATVAALLTLALAELQSGHGGEALAFAERGLQSPFFAATGSGLYLARAEALHALGRGDESVDAIREARDRIHRIATSLSDHEALRDSFLTNIVYNARTLELARQWLGANNSGGGDE
jgi:serine/threonine protein kinase